VHLRGAARVVAQRREAEQLLTTVEAHRSRAMVLLAEARRARDLLRVQCVFDRVTQLESVTQGAREGFASLDDAVASGDEGRREHALRLLMIYQQRAAVLVSESARCATPTRRTPTTETVVSVRTPPGLVDSDD
jgi:hypothetical protein